MYKLISKCLKRLRSVAMAGAAKRLRLRNTVLLYLYCMYITEEMSP